LTSKNIEKLPKHIAIIMDGNGRWAKLKGMKRTYGHKKGVESVREITSACNEIGIKHLTLYTFSEENWFRPKTEIVSLMNLLVKSLEKEKKKIHNNNIKFFVFGDLKKINKYIRNKLNEVVELTKDNTGLSLNLAISYGSRQEILHAIKTMFNENIDEIDENTFNKYLYTKDISDPDLLIRTGGDNRLSNFMLWQIAYTEIYFSKVYWPDFNKEELLIAINDYNKRERRFGKINS
jgi:undecaprenyl diphosphate synthase